MVLADIGNHKINEDLGTTCKTCSACGEELGRSAFSGKQWKARKVRRCDACASADRPVRTAPPAPARTMAPTEVLDLTYRLGVGAVAYYRHHHGVSLVRQSLQALMHARFGESFRQVMRGVQKILRQIVYVNHFFHEGLPPGRFAVTAKAPFDEAFCDQGKLTNFEILSTDFIVKNVRFALDKVFYERRQALSVTLRLVCCFQKDRPFVLFDVAYGNNSEFEARQCHEAAPAVFQRLLRKLGLERMKPAQLLATLLANACPECGVLSWPRTFRAKEGDFFELPKEDTPILAEAVGMLMKVVPDDAVPAAPHPELAKCELASGVANHGLISRAMRDEAKGDPKLMASLRRGLASPSEVSQRVARRLFVEEAYAWNLGQNQLHYSPRDWILSLKKQLPYYDDVIKALMQSIASRWSRRRLCAVCGRESPKPDPAFPVCHACGDRRYCGRDCQRADWAAGHRKECPRTRPKHSSSGKKGQNPITGSWYKGDG
jgi:hypothetical protein